MQKRHAKKLYHEHAAITGCGNTPIPPQQQVRQRPDQQFEGHEEYSLDLIQLDGNIMLSRQCIRLISVIMVATERQLVVNVELGLFIME